MSVPPVIYVDLPTGNRHGWGVCGDNLTEALGRLTAIERLVPGQPLPDPLDGPLLQAVGPSLRFRFAEVKSRCRACYAVFEDDLWVRRAAASALESFDIIGTACQWAGDVLRSAGLTAVHTVPHGVDTARFNPIRATRSRFADRFVIFSGGKFELRKAQDVVVRAFRIFADRHPDALLVAAWHTKSSSVHTMAASPYYPFRPTEHEPFEDSLRRWVMNAGIDLRRVELIPPLPNEALATIYGNSDVGLFPNRCEGATNLVLMEYMACGRATIASDFGGQRDVVSDATSLRLHKWKPFPVVRDGRQIACWSEPDVDEVLARLEQAYCDRDGMKELGRTSATQMAGWSWDRTARTFLDLMKTC